MGDFEAGGRMRRSRGRKQFSTSIFILLLVVWFPWPAKALDSPKGRSALVPSEWNPSLQEVQTYLEEEFASTGRNDQQFLNRTSRSMADLGDAQLFITYILLLQTMDSSKRTALYNEQKQWLQKRAAVARAAVQSQGGSLEPLEYSSAFRKMTEERLKELEGRLRAKRSIPKNLQRPKEE